MRSFNINTCFDRAIGYAHIFPHGRFCFHIFFYRPPPTGFQWRLQTHSKPRNPRVTEVADAKFKEMVNKLTAYKEQHGNCAVPVKYEEDPALGFWVKKQRNLKSSGKMREDREKMLNDLGFQWSGRRQSGGLEAVPASGDAAVKGEKVLEVVQAAAEHAREQELRGAEV